MRSLRAVSIAALAVLICGSPVRRCRRLARRGAQRVSHAPLGASSSAALPASSRARPRARRCPLRPSRAAAGCPNACSGGGVCSVNEICQCYPELTGDDCSQRLCPYGPAWTADALTPTATTAECGAQGGCDRCAAARSHGAARRRKRRPATAAAAAPPSRAGRPASASATLALRAPRASAVSERAPQQVARPPARPPTTLPLPTHARYPAPRPACAQCPARASAPAPAAACC